MRWLTMAVWLGLAIASRGDGGYFPEKAFPALPAIPVQRALVVWEEGRETLVVESAIDSASPGVGWVLPVPGEPSAIEPAPPGLLRVLSGGLYPRIEHDLTVGLGWFIFLTVLIGRLAVYVYWRRRHDNPAIGDVVMETVAIFLIAFFFFGMLLSTLGRAGNALTVGGVTVRQQTRVGAYEVSVLSTQTPEALEAWLTSEGLAALPAAARPVVADYAAQGWHFLVARLERETGGESQPHPLAVTFPVRAPVYPMRLTGLNGAPLQLELMVVADRRASCAGMKTIATGPVEGRAYSDLAATSQTVSLGGSGLSVHHPGLSRYVPDGKWLTKLTATLSPAEMARDFTIELGDGDPMRATVYSRQGARQMALIAGQLVLWALLLAVAFRQRPGPRDAPILPAFLRSLGWVLAVTALVSLGIRAALPVVPVETGRRHPQQELGWRLREGLVRETPAELRAGKDSALVGEEAAMNAALAWLDREGLRNPFTGEAIRAEYSPGNLIVGGEPGKRYLAIVGFNGRPDPVIEVRPDAVEQADR